jgi:hypothetical protein
MSAAKHLAQEIAKGSGNKIDLKLGDKVIHRLTQLRGQVIDVSTVGDQKMVIVRTVSGKILNRLNRQEFVLAASENFVIAQDVPVDEVDRFNSLCNKAVVAQEKIVGSISHVSILEELS